MKMRPGMLSIFSHQKSHRLKTLSDTCRRLHACRALLDSLALPASSCRGRSRPGCCSPAGTACTGHAWRTASAADTRTHLCFSRVCFSSTGSARPCQDLKHKSYICLLHPGFQTSSWPEARLSAIKKRGEEKRELDWNECIYYEQNGFVSFNSYFKAQKPVDPPLKWGALRFYGYLSSAAVKRQLHLLANTGKEK